MKCVSKDLPDTSPRIYLSLDKIVQQTPRSNHFQLSALPFFNRRADASSRPGDDVTQHLFPLDIQNLIAYASSPSHYLTPPRWCYMCHPESLRHIVVLVCEDISAETLDLYNKLSSLLPTLTGFTKFTDFVSPYFFGSSFFDQLIHVPLKNMEDGLRHSHCESADGADAFPRSLLLLTSTEMSRDNMPIPIPQSGMDHYVHTKTSYMPVTDSSPLYGLDCEMVATESGTLELARVTLVDSSHNTFYDQLVKPSHPITNYLTRYSGITAEMLAPITKTLSDVQQDFSRLLPADAILVGHSLNCDLHSLQMFHPYIIDTSVIFDLSGNRAQKCALKNLVHRFLGRTIQENKKGHCSAEDALASLQLVQFKLTKSFEFGNVSATSRLRHCLTLDKRHQPSPGTDGPMVKRLKIDRRGAEQNDNKKVLHSNQIVLHSNQIVLHSNKEVVHNNKEVEHSNNGSSGNNGVVELDNTGVLHSTYGITPDDNGIPHSIEAVLHINNGSEANNRVVALRNNEVLPSGDNNESTHINNTKLSPCKLIREDTIMKDTCKIKKSVPLSAHYLDVRYTPRTVSLTRLTSEANCRTSLIGWPETSRDSIDCSDWVSLPSGANDHAAVSRTTAKYSQSCRLVISHLTANLPSSASWKDRQVEMVNLDTSIRSVRDSLTKDSLLIVIFPGNTHNPNENGRCYIDMVS